MTTMITIDRLREATAQILGYQDWADATDYRTTGQQDRERERVFDILAALFVGQPPAGHLRAGLQEIVAAADRLSKLEPADQFREGYVMAFRDARAMALKALNQGDPT